MRRGLRSSPCDVQRPDGINGPFVRPPLCTFAAEKMLPVLRVLFSCFYSRFV